MSDASPAVPEERGLEERVVVVGAVLLLWAGAVGRVRCLGAHKPASHSVTRPLQVYRG